MTRFWTACLAAVLVPAAMAGAMEQARSLDKIDGLRYAQASEEQAGDQRMRARTRANIRKGPGTDHPRLGVLETGQEVRVTGAVGAWKRIEAPGGGVAFVHGSLLVAAGTQGETAAGGKKFTGHKLLRLVCQAYYSDDDRKWLNYVLILEQLSSATVNTSRDSETIDGSALIDPNHEDFFTDDARFRLRVYHATLISKEKTKEQIIEELLSREGDVGLGNRRMDWVGEGLRWGRAFTFNHEVKDGDVSTFIKTVNIFSVRDLEGYMSTNLGSTTSTGDHLYRCLEPTLVPERVQEGSGG